MLYGTLRKVTCTHIKRVRCVGVYSGMMYGCVRYVFRVSASSLSAFLLLLLLLLLLLMMLLLLLLVVLLPSVRIQKHLFYFPFDGIYRRLIFFTLGLSVSS